MKMRSLALCATTVLLAGTLMTGCADPSRGASLSSDDPAVANRTYMSDVRSAFSKIEAEMDSFSAAVRADSAGIVKDSLAKVEKVVDSLETIKVPAGLEAVHKGYSEAGKQLASALHDYVDYRQGDKSVALTAIQMEYDKGLATLKNADELASSM